MELPEFYRGKRCLSRGIPLRLLVVLFVRMLTLAGAQVTGYGFSRPQPSMFEITGLRIQSIICHRGDIMWI